MSKRKKEERGRFTAKWKSEAVLRLLKGEDLNTDEHVARYTKNAFYNNMLPGAVIAI